MNKSMYDNKPKAIEAIGNGSYFYRWNIEEIEMSNGAIEDEMTVIKWQCNEVVIWSPLSANKITEEVIKALWGDGAEEKYLNDYNAAQLGILDNSYIQKYKDFLQERKVIKEQIDNDWNNYIK